MWIDTDEAAEKMSQSGSQQGSVLEDAIKLIKKKGKAE